MSHFHMLRNQSLNSIPTYVFNSEGPLISVRTCVVNAIFSCYGTALPTNGPLSPCTAVASRQMQDHRLQQHIVKICHFFSEPHKDTYIHAYVYRLRPVRNGEWTMPRGRHHSTQHLTLFAVSSHWILDKSIRKIMRWIEFPFVCILYADHFAKNIINNIRF